MMAYHEFTKTEKCGHYVCYDMVIIYVQDLFWHFPPNCYATTLISYLPFTNIPVILDFQIKNHQLPIQY
jgi:hypothetical protein